MKGIAKFAEYSISGGFLWLNVIIFITLLSLPSDTSHDLLGSTLELWGNWVKDYTSHLQASSEFDLFKNSLNTLAAALFVLLIFCTGLALDLLSPFFCSQVEVIYFRKNIKNKDHLWFKKFISEHKEYIQDDYEKFIEEPLFKLSSPDVWRVQKKRYNRINSFLMAYLFANSGNTYLDQLTDKIRLWYTSRSLTTALLVLGVLLNLLVVSDSVVVASVASTVLYVFVVPLLLVVLSLALTIGAFCRVNASMLALAYQIHSKNNC